MNPHRRSIPTASVVLALVLFAGVLLMAYGQFNHDRMVLLLGLIITGLGAVRGVVLVGIPGKR
jgi:hypothetical protein